MKKIALLLAAVLTVAINSCTTSDKMECVQDSYSSKHLSMDMNLQLPSKSNYFATYIREDLLFRTADLLCREYDDVSPSARELKRLFKENAKRVEDEMAQFYDTDTDPSIQWSISYKCERIVDTDGFCVYMISRYSFNGGAYPNVLELYYTYDNIRRELVYSFFNDKRGSRGMQTLIYKGLRNYFRSIGINDPDVWNSIQLFNNGQETFKCYPSKDGIVIVIQGEQHAIGTPTFTISYEEMAPYLSDQLIGIVYL